VEHLCYKCQASIDESLPFCPHCGASQIRVAVPDENAALDELTSLAGSAAAWPGNTASYQPNIVQWEFAWKGALLAGITAGILTALPFISTGICLWLVGSGALAVMLYQRRVPGVYVTTGMGLRMGALAGVIGFVTFAICGVVSFVLDPNEFRKLTVEAMQKSMVSNPDPKAQELMSQFFNNLNNPGVLATFFVFVLVLMAIVFVIFSAAGGALGASMFGRRTPR
jgi:hypothetical protein